MSVAAPPDRKLRVLEISHSGVVSAWRQRERLLLRRGLDVSVVTAAVWEEGGKPVRFDPGGDLFATGIRTVGRHPNVFLYDPRPLWRLLGRPWDLIDIHEEPCSLASAEVLLLRALRCRRTPYVLYSAQNIDKRYPPPFRWTERWALRRAAAISVCNAAAARIVRRKGLRGLSAEIPLGVDVNHFAPADRSPPSGGLNIGYVGRLADHKGVDVLLESIAPHPEWTLDIVGRGPCEGPLRRQADALGIAHRVRFTGAADHDDLADRYRTFDVVVVPSIATPEWEEQFCRVAVESMASGVPVIASHSGALPEVIGDAGRLVPEADASALRAALAEVAEDGRTWSTMRAAGLERSARFAWEAVADDYLALYRRAVRS